MTEKFDLDRQTNLDNNIDGQGKKWEIKQERGRALYFARPNPDRADMLIPKNMQGLWTKVELLMTEIKMYVKQSWEHADLAAAKALRVKEAAKEADNARKAEIKAAVKKVTKKKVAKKAA